MKRVCLVGGGGRLGRRIAGLLADASQLCHHATLVRLAPPAVPGDALEARRPQVTADAEAALEGADLIIDVAAPPVTHRLAPLAAARRLPYLAAATGLTQADHAALGQLARVAPVLLAPNLSVQMAALMAAVRTLSRQLGVGQPHGPAVEIYDLHRQGKLDVPSGTARALGEAVGGAAMFRATRLGDAAGEHTVSFFGAGERLELVHRVSDKDVFARGALVAALWLLAQSPGLWHMHDVAGAQGVGRVD